MSEIEDWYLFRRGKRYGPGALPYLRASTGNDGEEPDDMIWRPGMDIWVPASQAGFYSAVIVTPATQKPPAAPRYTPPPEETSPGGITRADKEARLRASSEKGIGGWLILLGFTIVVGAIRQAYEIIKSVIDIQPAFGRLPGIWQGYVSVTLLVSTVLLIAWIYTAYLFFNRRAAFSTYFSITLAGILLTQVGSMMFGAIALNVPPDPTDYRDLGRTFFYCLIWCTYIVVSRRVRYTFVH